MKTQNILNAFEQQGYTVQDHCGIKGDLQICWSGDIVLYDSESGAVATVINPLVKFDTEEEVADMIKEMEEQIDLMR